jgi:hypothetical protein
MAIAIKIEQLLFDTSLIKILTAKIMFSWLNPFRWWRLHRYWRQWKNINCQFTHAYTCRDFSSAADLSQWLVDISLRSNNKKILLATYESLFTCYEQIKYFEMALGCKQQIIKSKQLVQKELRKYLIEDRWWI